MSHARADEDQARVRTSVIGAIGITAIGLSWMRWTPGHTTARLAAEGRESALIAALTPFCVAEGVAAAALPDLGA